MNEKQKEMAWISVYFCLAHSVAWLRWASNWQRQFQKSQAIPFQAKRIPLQSIPASGWFLNEVYIALASYFMVSKRNQFIPFVTMTKKKKKKRTARALSKGMLDSRFQVFLSDWRILQSFLMFYLVEIKGSLYRHGCIFKKQMISSWVKKKRTVRFLQWSEQRKS